MVLAQDGPHFEELLNDLMLEPELAGEIEEVYQQLYDFYLQPLDINKATHADFKKLFFMDDLKIQQIIDYRKEAGDFISIYELQSIEGLSFEDINRLKNLVTVKEKSKSKPTSKILLIRYERDLQKRKGYRINENGEPNYLGTPDKLLFQLRNSSGGKVQYGFTAEKDAGENVIYDASTKRYGLDHYSGYFKINNILSTGELIIGDYQLQFGQGLVYSSGFNLGKSGGSVATYQKVSFGIRPHTSSMESGFLRGAAGSYFITQRLKLTGFYSDINHDAVIKGSSFSGFNTSGLHRTYKELERKKAINENQFGLVIERKGNNLQYGGGFSNISFSQTWIPIERVYNNFSFTGNRMTTAFGYVNYRWQNISSFAEGANLLNNGSAFLVGALVNLSSVFNTGFIYRNYQPDFVSRYGKALGEKLRNNNEKGLLWVFNVDLSKKIKAGAYFDKFSFPWLSYRISKPSTGYEYMLHLQYRPSKKTDVNVQYKEEQKERDFKEKNLISPIPIVKRQYKIRFRYVITENLEMRSMVQGSLTEESTGVALLQDIIYQKMKYKVIFRYSLFDTDDFENRQYVYENDVLYAFNFPALQGTGYKFYILAKYNISRDLKCWLRFSQLTYSNRDEIGTGNETIQGNKLSEVKFQLIYNF